MRMYIIVNKLIMMNVIFVCLTATLGTVKMFRFYSLKKVSKKKLNILVTFWGLKVKIASPFQNIPENKTKIFF